MPTALRSALRRLVALGGVVTAAMLAPRTAAAQRISPQPAGEKAGSLLPLIGAQYGAPERFAGLLGVVLTTARSGDVWAGYALIADGGQGGARVSLATVNRGATGLGAEVRVSAIRTWRNSSVVARNQSFVGPELRVSLTALTVGAGYYWRTAGTTLGDHSFSAVTFAIEF